MIFLLEAKRMNKFKLLIFLLLSVVGIQAKEIPAKPNPPRLVNDFAGVLAPDQLQSLESKLVAYSDSTSTQITIVIENSLEGDDDFDYSYRIAQGWQIGMKGKNNGLLIYVAIEDRKIRIQNGYGLEGTITDALSRRVIEENIKPNFKGQNYFQGLDEATDIFMRAASGEFINDTPRNRKSDSPPPLIVILIIIIIIIILIFRNKNGGHHRGYSGVGPFFGTFGSGGFSGGGGFGGGGGDSGGFGGFGGGSFGGGGAGGDW